MRKLCAYCKKLLVPKVFASGRTEQAAQVSHRNYCDNDCYQAELEEKKRLKKMGGEVMDKFLYTAWRE